LLPHKINPEDQFSLWGIMIGIQIEIHLITHVTIPVHSQK